MDCRYARRHRRARRTSITQAAHRRVREGRRPRGPPGVKGPKELSKMIAAVRRSQSPHFSHHVKLNSDIVVTTCCRSNENVPVNAGVGRGTIRENTLKTGSKSAIADLASGGPDVAVARGYELSCRRQSCVRRIPRDARPGTDDAAGCAPLESGP